MSNSQVIDCDFDYYSPKTVEEALEYLKSEGVKVLAGGTDLLNDIKTGEIVPKALVSILGINELDFVEFEHGFRIGPATLLCKIEEDDRIKKKYPALCEAVNSMGGMQIRNMATLGGNLCTASPGADAAPPLIVLNAKVEVSRKNGRGEIERRTLPIEEFFTGPKKTVLEQGELLTSILIPEPDASSGSAFIKIGRVKLDIAKINCAVYVKGEGDICKNVRISLGAVAPKPVRAFNVEKALAGKKLTASLLAEAAEMVSQDISPRNARSTAVYKTQAASVLIQDTLTTAWNRSGAGREVKE